MYKTQITTTGTALFAKEVNLNALLLAAGSDAATAKLYEGTSASDPLICQINAITGTSEPFYFKDPGEIVSKVFVVITGTSANLSVIYS